MMNRNHSKRRPLPLPWQFAVIVFCMAAALAVVLTL
jgi:hypothetical protein